MYLSLLVERFILTKMIRVRNKDKPWFNDDCRLAYDIKQVAHLRWIRDRSLVNWDELPEEGQCCICRGYASV